MFKKIYWFVALLLLLCLPALACGVFGGDDPEPTAVPVVEPAQVEPTTPPPVEEESGGETAGETAVDTAEEPAADEQPADTSAPVEEAPPLPDTALSLDTIDELPFNSYRLLMVLEMTGTDANAQEVTQSINADFAISNEPQAMDIVMSFSGIDEELDAGSIEMAQIEGTSYMVVPEMGCITTSGEDLLAENPFTDMMNPDQFLENLDDAKYEGEEIINDIVTRHYSFDKFAMTDTDLNDIETAEGHVYIAKEGDFLVRMILDATGQVDLFDEGVTEDGVMHIEINLTDIDQPIEVTIPEACANQGGGEGGAGSEFPMLDDATAVTSFAGVLTYETALSMEDILAFYDEVLAAEGWVKDEAGSFIGGGNALINYTRDGVTLSLTVSPNEDGNGGNYVILLSDAEG